MNEPVSHVPVEFPKEFPGHSIMHIVGHVRGTESLTLSQFLQHAGCILGSAGKLMESGPTPVGASAEDFSTASNEELASQLESACAPQAGDGAEAIPAWLIPIILEIARRWFKF